MPTNYTIKGQTPLRGAVSVKGSPLATVGLLAAALLTPEKVTLTNVPHLRDLDNLLQELRTFGIMADWTHQHEVTLHAENVTIPYDRLTWTDIAGWPPSLLAALIIRAKYLSIKTSDLLAYHSDFLWDLLPKFGIEIVTQEHETIIRVSHLHSANVELINDMAEQTLTAIILAATADGQSLLGQVVVNPEIEDMLTCLKSMEANIERLDEQKVAVTGQAELAGVIHPVSMDRYEAAFWAAAAIITEGDIQINDIRSNVVLPFLAKLEQMGASYTVDLPTIRVWRDKHQADLASISLTARPFPGLGDDWLLLCLPLQAMANGEAILQPADSAYVTQGLEALKQFAGEGRIDHQGAHIFGPVALQAATFAAKGFAASVVGVLSALNANGQSTIQEVDSLDNRFEQVSERLLSLGAKIERQETS